MVQEYLRGRTLREALAKDALALERALLLGTEMAEALKAAHRAGIVHRDLKPENVFVTEDGHAKVLDFGLAKLTEAAGGPLGSQSMSPTALGTQAGSIMGTAGYMAPEQVQGEQVDHRADMFAFGCVLHEMVSGQRAFSGRNVLDTLGLIIDQDPRAVTEINPALPGEIHRIVRKSLAKDPARRYQHADDLAVDLRTLSIEVETGTARPAGGLSSTAAEAASETVPEPGPIASRSPWLVAAALATAVVITAVATAVVVRNNTALAPQRPERLVIDVPDSQSLATALGGFDLFHPLTISPDGSQIVYSAVGPDGLMLYLRRIGELVAAPIAGSARGHSPIFSPNGQWIGFLTGDSTLHKVPVVGGASQPIAEGVSGLGFDWGPDDSIVFAVANGLMKVAAAGGTAEGVTPRGDATGEPLDWPAFLPGGDHVLVTRRGTSTIGLVDLATGELQDLGISGSHARYVATGHLVYAVGDALFAVPFDLATREPSGNSVPVLGEVSAGLLAVSRFAVSSETGSLVYLPGDLGADARRLLWVDRSGNSTPVLDEERAYQGPRLSPEGGRVAMTLGDGEGTDSVWILELRNSSLTRLTVDGDGASPVWSPDGEWVYFSSTRGGGGADVFRRRADFSGSAENVLTKEFDQWPQAVSADGLISAIELHPQTSWDIIVVSADGEEVRPFVATPAAEALNALSPDGKWSAYFSDESGNSEIYVQPFPDGGSRFTISNNGGVHPVWSPDGHSIFYNLGPKMFAVDVTTDSEFDHGAPYELFDHAYYDGAERQFDIAPDGERFLMIDTNQDAAAAAPRINIILNWFEELKERVPTGQ